MGSDLEFYSQIDQDDVSTPLLKSLIRLSDNY